jgi:hypothetical protein
VLTEPIVPLLCVPPLPTPSVLHKLGLILNTLSPDLLPPLEFFEEIECTPDLEAWAIQRVTHG